MAKEWVAVFSLIISIAIGVAIYTIWSDFRPDDEWMWPALAGLSGTVMVYILLHKLRGGG